MGEAQYAHGEIVWVKLRYCWWPGHVVHYDYLPEEIREDLSRKPFLVVGFFQEDSYEYVKNDQSVCPYGDHRKDEFIKRGMDFRRLKHSYMDNFAADVCIAEKKTGGNINILDDPKFASPQKASHNSQFGSQPSKEKKKRLSGKANRGKAKQRLSYTISHPRFLAGQEPEVHVLIQPRADTSTSLYDHQFHCQKCGFSTSRVGVISEHYKLHASGALKNSRPEQLDAFVGIPRSKTRTIDEDLLLAEQGLGEEDEDMEIIENTEENVEDSNKQSTSVDSNKQKVISLADEWDEEKEEPDISEPHEDEPKKAVVDISDVKNKNKTTNDTSCFDFHEDDKGDGLVATVALAEGRKIPRVIEPMKKLSKQDDIRGDGQTDEERDLVISKEVDDLLEDSERLLKAEQNFQSDRIVKIPDKAMKKATKLTIPKKRLNKSFKGTKQNLRKSDSDDMKVKTTAEAILDTNAIASDDVATEEETIESQLAKITGEPIDDDTYSSNKSKLDSKQKRLYKLKVRPGMRGGLSSPLDEVLSPKIPSKRRKKQTSDIINQLEDAETTKALNIEVEVLAKEEEKQVIKAETEQSANAEVSLIEASKNVDFSSSAILIESLSSSIDKETTEKHTLSRKLRSSKTNYQTLDSPQTSKPEQTAKESKRRKTEIEDIGSTDGDSPVQRRKSARYEKISKTEELENIDTPTEDQASPSNLDLSSTHQSNEKDLKTISKESKHPKSEIQNVSGSDLNLPGQQRRKSSKREKMQNICDSPEESVEDCGSPNNKDSAETVDATDGKVDKEPKHSKSEVDGISTTDDVDVPVQHRRKSARHEKLSKIDDLKVSDAPSVEDCGSPKNIDAVETPLHTTGGKGPKLGVAKESKNSTSEVKDISANDVDLPVQHRRKSAKREKIPKLDDPKNSDTPTCAEYPKSEELLVTNQPLNAPARNSSKPEVLKTNTKESRRNKLEDEDVIINDGDLPAQQRRKSARREILPKINDPKTSDIPSESAVEPLDTPSKKDSNSEVLKAVAKELTNNKPESEVVTIIDEELPVQQRRKSTRREKLLKIDETSSSGTSARSSVDHESSKNEEISGTHQPLNRPDGKNSNLEVLKTTAKVLTRGKLEDEDVIVIDKELPVQQRRKSARREKFTKIDDPSSSGASVESSIDQESLKNEELSGPSDIPDGKDSNTEVLKTTAKASTRGKFLELEDVIVTDEESPVQQRRKSARRDKIKKIDKPSNSGTPAESMADHESSKNEVLLGTHQLVDTPDDKDSKSEVLETTAKALTRSKLEVEDVVDEELPIQQRRKSSRREKCAKIDKPSNNVESSVDHECPKNEEPSSTHQPLEVPGGKDSKPEVLAVIVNELTCDKLELEEVNIIDEELTVQQRRKSARRDKLQKIDKPIKSDPPAGSSVEREPLKKEEPSDIIDVKNSKPEVLKSTAEESTHDVRESPNNDEPHQKLDTPDDKDSRLEELKTVDNESSASKLEPEDSITINEELPIQQRRKSTRREKLSKIDRPNNSGDPAGSSVDHESSKTEEFSGTYQPLDTPDGNDSRPEVLITTVKEFKPKVEDVIIIDEDMSVQQRRKSLRGEKNLKIDDPENSNAHAQSARNRDSSENEGPSEIHEPLETPKGKSEIEEIHSNLEDLPISQRLKTARCEKSPIIGESKKSDASTKSVEDCEPSKNEEPLVVSHNESESLKAAAKELKRLKSKTEDITSTDDYINVQQRRKSARHEKLVKTDEPKNSDSSTNPVDDFTAKNKKPDSLKESTHTKFETEDAYEDLPLQQRLKSIRHAKIDETVSPDREPTHKTSDVRNDEASKSEISKTVSKESTLSKSYNEDGDSPDSLKKSMLTTSETEDVDEGLSLIQRLKSTRHGKFSKIDETISADHKSIPQTLDVSNDEASKSEMSKTVGKGSQPSKSYSEDGNSPVQNRRKSARQEKFSKIDKPLLCDTPVISTQDRVPAKKEILSETYQSADAPNDKTEILETITKVSKSPKLKIDEICTNDDDSPLQHRLRSARHENFPIVELISSHVSAKSVEENASAKSKELSETQPLDAPDNNSSQTEVLKTISKESKSSKSEIKDGDSPFQVRRKSARHEKFQKIDETVNSYVPTICAEQEPVISEIHPTLDEPDDKSSETELLKTIAKESEHPKSNIDVHSSDGDSSIQRRRKSSRHEKLLKIDESINSNITTKEHRRVSNEEPSETHFSLDVIDDTSISEMLKTIGKDSTNSKLLTEDANTNDGDSHLQNRRKSARHEKIQKIFELKKSEVVVSQSLDAQDDNALKPDSLMAEESKNQLELKDINTNDKSKNIDSSTESTKKCRKSLKKKIYLESHQPSEKPDDENSGETNTNDGDMTFPNLRKSSTHENIGVSKNSNVTMEDRESLKNKEHSDSHQILNTSDSKSINLIETPSKETTYETSSNVGDSPKQQRKPSRKSKVSETKNNDVLSETLTTQLLEALDSKASKPEPLKTIATESVPAEAESEKISTNDRDSLSKHRRKSPRCGKLSKFNDPKLNDTPAVFDPLRTKEKLEVPQLLEDVVEETPRKSGKHNTSEIAACQKVSKSKVKEHPQISETSKDEEIVETPKVTKFSTTDKDEESIHQRSESMKRRKSPTHEDFAPSSSQKRRRSSKLEDCSVNIEPLAIEKSVECIPKNERISNIQLSSIKKDISSNPRSSKDSLISAESNTQQESLTRRQSTEFEQQRISPKSKTSSRAKYSSQIDELEDDKVVLVQGVSPQISERSIPAKDVEANTLAKHSTSPKTRKSTNTEKSSKSGKMTMNEKSEPLRGPSKSSPKGKGPRLFLGKSSHNEDRNLSVREDVSKTQEYLSTEETQSEKNPKEGVLVKEDKTAKSDSRSRRKSSRTDESQKYEIPPKRRKSSKTEELSSSPKSTSPIDDAGLFGEFVKKRRKFSALVDPSNFDESSNSSLDSTKSRDIETVPVKTSTSAAGSSKDETLKKPESLKSRKSLKLDKLDSSKKQKSPIPGETSNQSRDKECTNIEVASPSNSKSKELLKQKKSPVKKEILKIKEKPLSNEPTNSSPVTELDNQFKKPELPEKLSDARMNRPMPQKKKIQKFDDMLAEIDYALKSRQVPVKHKHKQKKSPHATTSSPLQNKVREQKQSPEKTEDLQMEEINIKMKVRRSYPGKRLKLDADKHLNEKKIENIAENEELQLKTNIEEQLKQIDDNHSANTENSPMDKEDLLFRESSIDLMKPTEDIEKVPSIEIPSTNSERKSITDDLLNISYGSSSSAHLLQDLSSIEVLRSASGKQLKRIDDFIKTENSTKSEKTLLFGESINVKKDDTNKLSSMESEFTNSKMKSITDDLLNISYSSSSSSQLIQLDLPSTQVFQSAGARKEFNEIDDHYSSKTENSAKCEENLLFGELMNAGKEDTDKLSSMESEFTNTKKEEIVDDLPNICSEDSSSAQLNKEYFTEVWQSEIGEQIDVSHSTKPENSLKSEEILTCNESVGVEKQDVAKLASLENESAENKTNMKVNDSPNISYDDSSSMQLKKKDISCTEQTVEFFSPYNMATDNVQHQTKVSIKRKKKISRWDNRTVSPVALSMQTFAKQPKTGVVIDSKVSRKSIDEVKTQEEDFVSAVKMTEGSLPDSSCDQKSQDLPSYEEKNQLQIPQFTEQEMEGEMKSETSPILCEVFDSIEVTTSAIVDETKLDSVKADAEFNGQNLDKEIDYADEQNATEIFSKVSEATEASSSVGGGHLFMVNDSKEQILTESSSKSSDDAKHSDAELPSTKEYLSSVFVDKLQEENTNTTEQPITSNLYEIIKSNNAGEQTRYVDSSEKTTIEQYLTLDEAKKDSDEELLHVIEKQLSSFVDGDKVVSKDQVIIESVAGVDKTLKDADTKIVNVKGKHLGLVIGDEQLYNDSTADQQTIVEMSEDETIKDTNADIENVQDKPVLEDHLHAADVSKENLEAVYSIETSSNLIGDSNSCVNLSNIEKFEKIVNVLKDDLKQPDIEIPKDTVVDVTTPIVIESLKDEEIEASSCNKSYDNVEQQQTTSEQVKSKSIEESERENIEQSERESTEESERESTEKSEIKSAEFESKSIEDSETKSIEESKSKSFEESVSKSIVEPGNKSIADSESSSIEKSETKYAEVQLHTENLLEENISLEEDDKIENEPLHENEESNVQKFLKSESIANKITDYNTPSNLMTDSLLYNNATGRHTETFANIQEENLPSVQVGFSSSNLIDDFEKNQTDVIEQHEKESVLWKVDEDKQENSINSSNVVVEALPSIGLEFINDETSSNFYRDVKESEHPEQSSSLSTDDSVDVPKLSTRPPLNFDEELKNVEALLTITDGSARLVERLENFDSPSEVTLGENLTNVATEVFDNTDTFKSIDSKQWNVVSESKNDSHLNNTTVENSIRESAITTLSMCADIIAPVLEENRFDGETNSESIEISKIMAIEEGSNNVETSDFNDVEMQLNDVAQYVKDNENDLSGAAELTSSTSMSEEIENIAVEEEKIFESVDVRSISDENVGYADIENLSAAGSSSNILNFVKPSMSETNENNYETENFDVKPSKVDLEIPSHDNCDLQVGNLKTKLMSKLTTEMASPVISKIANKKHPRTTRTFVIKGTVMGDTKPANIVVKDDESDTPIMADIRDVKPMDNQALITEVVGQPYKQLSNTSMSDAKSKLMETLLRTTNDASSSGKANEGEKELIGRSPQKMEGLSSSKDDEIIFDYIFKNQKRSLPPKKQMTTRIITTPDSDKKKIVIRQAIPSHSRSNEQTFKPPVALKAAKNDSTQISIQKVPEIQDFDDIETFIIKKKAPAPRTEKPTILKSVDANNYETYIIQNPTAVPSKSTTVRSVPKEKPRILDQTIINPGGLKKVQRIPHIDKSERGMIHSKTKIIEKKYDSTFVIDGTAFGSQHATKEIPSSTFARGRFPNTKFQTIEEKYDNPFDIETRPGPRHGTRDTPLLQRHKTYERKRTFPNPSKPTKNKIMVVTNQQGQQQRVLLTPQQQKQMVVERQKQKPNILSQTIIRSPAITTATAQPSGSTKLLNRANRGTPPLAPISKPVRRIVPPPPPPPPAPVCQTVMTSISIEQPQLALEQQPQPALEQQPQPELVLDGENRPPHQLVIQDAMGNQTTIVEGQILALPSNESVDSYVLVTLDSSGNLTPLDNDALMSLDLTLQQQQEETPATPEASPASEVSERPISVVEEPQEELALITASADQLSMDSVVFDITHHETSLASNSQATDILAAALADATSSSSIVFPPPASEKQVTSACSIIMTPIMTPLEQPPLPEGKKSDEADILKVSPKDINVELPITVTDPSISHTLEDYAGSRSFSMPLLTTPANTVAVLSSSSTLAVDEVNLSLSEPPPDMFDFVADFGDENDGSNVEIPLQSHVTDSRDMFE